MDADSDDDGISDGDELAGPDGDTATTADNTNPNDPDSDADGLQDGTELGMTTPLAGGNSDGANPVSFAGTDPATMIVDADPTTTTDPMNPDTDAGGVCDGSNSVTGVCIAGEDANNNGGMDAGETEPMLANDDDSDGDGLSNADEVAAGCLLYTSPSPRDKRQSRMPSSA